MKKLFIGITLFGVFLIYSFHEHKEGVVVPALPVKTSQNNSDASLQPTSSQATNVSYKDGSYTGDVTDAYYGNVQVQTTIANGKITDVQFLQYPNDRGESIQINSQAIPLLKQEAIQTQAAQVDVITGATQTSNAFIQSLQSALTKAQ